MPLYNCDQKLNGRRRSQNLPPEVERTLTVGREAIFESLEVLMFSALQVWVANEI